jgi:hypothetical protein
VAHETKGRRLDAIHLPDLYLHLENSRRSEETHLRLYMMALSNSMVGAYIEVIDDIDLDRLVGVCDGKIICVLCKLGI